MSSWKDEWKTIYQSNTEWLRIRKNGTEPTLEVAIEVGTYEDKEGFEQKKFHVYRVEIERFKLVSDPNDVNTSYLVPENYSPSWLHPLADYEAWFARDLEKIARTVGEEPLNLAKQFTSKDPKIRAGAYNAIGGYHGFANFDDDPLELDEPDLNKRWK
jgi:hypothetical protein